MSSGSTWKAAALASVVLLFLAACDGLTVPPTGPTHLNRLVIDGPADLAPGQAIQFNARIESAGGTRVVTDQTTWMSTVPAVMAVDSRGRVTAQQNGESRLSAVFDRLMTSVTVIVAPAGTFRLSGVVEVSDSSTYTVYPLVGGAVEVMMQDGTRQSTGTGASGQFAVYGVLGDVRVRITKSGYSAVDQAMRISKHESINYEVYPLAPGARN